MAKNAPAASGFAPPPAVVPTAEQLAAHATQAADEAAALVARDPEPLRQDGPTLEEYVEAGYKAENYPPKGYAVRVAVQLVKMTRNTTDYPAPHVADVHPDEVMNYAPQGWVPAEDDGE